MVFTKQFILEALSESLAYLIKQGVQKKMVMQDDKGNDYLYDGEENRQKNINGTIQAMEKVRNGTLSSSDDCFLEVTSAVFDKSCREHPASKKTDDDICCELIKQFPISTKRSSK